MKKNIGSVILDSTKISSDNKFSFSGKKVEQGLLFIELQAHKGRYAAIFMGADDVSVVIPIDSIERANVKGSATDELFKKLVEKVESIELSSSKELQDKYMEAVNQNDTLLAMEVEKKMMEKYKEMESQISEISVSFIKENPDSPVSAFILKTLRGISNSELKEYYGILSDDVKKTSFAQEVRDRIEESESQEDEKNADNKDEDHTKNSDSKEDNHENHEDHDGHNHDK
ncbi:hypothetical protein JBKA6_0416 [Ichthyobacterium seriolicida]|uniref:DUF4369 domain-containing protein n=2 Tax=Ichthyobacterium seriolicida TaxID=242600 RepID=A0A1J1E0G9_9FLAO|nr:hypothetical protein JBKA6_0416 [Ichthyobacterium seriolicida]